MALASARREPQRKPGHEAEFELRILQLGALGVVVGACHIRLRSRSPRGSEGVTAQVAGSARQRTAGARQRLEVTAADALLGVFLAASLASTLLAENHWLTFRAFGLSMSGALLFWSARAVARGGHAERLVRTLAAAVVLGAGFALLQAYGLELE